MEYIRMSVGNSTGDNTGAIIEIHAESYPHARKLLEEIAVECKAHIDRLASLDQEEIDRSEHDIEEIASYRGGCPYCGSYEGDATECPECGHGQ